MRRRPEAAAVERVAVVDWRDVASSLDERGYATTAALLTTEECRGLAALYDRDEAFRSRVVMQAHGFGRGEYRYLRYPLPGPVEALRRAIYPRLAPIANRWRERLREEGQFPPALAAYLKECHAAGQERPTPLILKYEAGDYNCLHQDLYGDLVFPLQLTVLLSAPEDDFTGGEFLLVEQRPRAQSKGEVVPLRQAEAVIFPVHHRPIEGSRGPYRVTIRHGVSRIRSGRRFTLGIDPPPPRGRPRCLDPPAPAALGAAASPSPWLRPPKQGLWPRPPALPLVPPSCCSWHWSGRLHGAPPPPAARPLAAVALRGPCPVAPVPVQSDPV